MNLFKIIIIFSVAYFDYLIIKINPLAGIILIFAEILLYIKIRGKIFGIPIKENFSKYKERSEQNLMENLFKSAFKDIIKDKLKQHSDWQSYQKLKEEKYDKKMMPHKFLEIGEESNQFSVKWDLTQIKITHLKKFLAILGLYSLFLAGIAVYQLLQLPFDKSPFIIFGGIFIIISFFCFYSLKKL